MAKKRTKKVNEFVALVNNYLKSAKIKDEFSSDLFWFASSYLIKQKMYEGYNYFVEKFTEDGKSYSALAGTNDKAKYDYIQFF